jgi:hypothetical protein
MNRTQSEKQARRESRTNRGAQREQARAGRSARESLKAAADRQIAEIERTFTPRYEW